MGEAKRKAELFSRAKEEMERWGERPIVLHIGITTLIGLCGALQLALRHPQFGAGPTAKHIRECINSWLEAIPPEFPAIRQIISAGFNPEFDDVRKPAPRERSGPELKSAPTDNESR